MKYTTPGPIQLGEHQWTPPLLEDILEKMHLPDAKKEILFQNNKKEDQYWRRAEDLPEFFLSFGPETVTDAEYTQWDDARENVLFLSREDTKTLIEYRDREIRRMIYGVYFMNKGKVTYLTGDHYGALQWCVMMDIGTYGGYRRFQAEALYFTQLVEEDRKCTGGYTVKPKKTGITILYAFKYLVRSITRANQNLGMMSKSQEDAQKAQFRWIKHAYDNFPYVLKPDVKTDNESKFEFGTPRSKNTGTIASKKKQSNNSKGLNSHIFCAPNKEDAFDNIIWNIVWYDELPKCKAPGPQRIFEKGLATVKEGELLVGKIFMTSYNPEFDDDSFKEARAIYFNSKLSTINEFTGRTTSELYVYPILAHYGLQTDDNLFDKYGEIDQDVARQHIEFRRKQLENNPQELQSFIRRFPLTEEEAWRIGGGGGSTYNNIRLGIRLGQIEEANKYAALPFITGTLEWMGERLKSEVRFIADNEEDIKAGRRSPLYIYHPEWLPAGKLNQPQKQPLRDDLDRPMPSAATPFIIATDPTEYALKSDVAVGSKDAITGMILPDAQLDAIHQKRVSNRFFLRYLARPENPLDYYEMLIKIIWWLGAYAYIESNKKWVITKAKEDNLHNFLLVRDRQKQIVPYNEYEHTSLPDTTKETIGDYVRMTKLYLVAPETPEDHDNLETIFDDEMVKQWMEFKTEDTKKYDLAMCASSNITAMYAFLGYRQKLAARENNMDQDLFRMSLENLLVD